MVEYGLQAMARMANEDVAICNDILKVGGVEMILDEMERNPLNRDIQMYGSWAIGERDIHIIFELFFELMD